MRRPAFITALACAPVCAALVVAMPETRAARIQRIVTANAEGRRAAG